MTSLEQDLEIKVNVKFINTIINEEYQDSLNLKGFLTWFYKVKDILQRGYLQFNLFKFIFYSVMDYQNTG